MLFSLSLSVGAREMAGDKRLCIQSFRRGGYFLGMAFQVQDDILDYLGSRQRFGKPPGQDLRDGQVTLPLIEALVSRNPGNAEVAERQKSLIQHIGQFRQGTEEVLDTIIHDIHGLGGFSAADTRSRSYLEKARREFQKACKECKTPGVLERLDLLLGFLENRRY
jgi:heptaprenyl diphosphate synthase